MLVGFRILDRCSLCHLLFWRILQHRAAQPHISASNSPRRAKAGVRASRHLTVISQKKLKTWRERNETKGLFHIASTVYGYRKGLESVWFLMLSVSKIVSQGINTDYSYHNYLLASAESLLVLDDETGQRWREENKGKIGLEVSTKVNNDIDLDGCAWRHF